MKTLDTRKQVKVDVPYRVAGRLVTVTGVPASEHPTHGPCVEMELSRRIRSALDALAGTVTRIGFDELMGGSVPAKSGG